MVSTIFLEENKDGERKKRDTHAAYFVAFIAAICRYFSFAKTDVETVALKPIRRASECGERRFGERRAPALLFPRSNSLKDCP